MFQNSVFKAAGKTVDEMIDKLALKGKYVIEVFRAGVLISTVAFANLVTNEGKNKLFDVMFHNQTQIATWYIGLIDNTGFTGTLATDTASSHAGWTEYVGYSETVRQDWVEDAAASQQITNTAPSVFNINATGSVRGIFVSSINTKGNNTGTLWSTALFPTTLPVTNGDQVKISYTVAA